MIRSLEEGEILERVKDIFLFPGGLDYLQKHRPTRQFKLASLNEILIFGGTEFKEKRFERISRNLDTFYDCARLHLLIQGYSGLVNMKRISESYIFGIFNKVGISGLPVIEEFGAKRDLD